MGRFKAETGVNHPLPDVKRKHLELRAGSGFAAENPIDVGVRDGAKNGPDLEKVPKMSGDVPVRDALDRGAGGRSDSRDGTRRVMNRGKEER